MAHTWLCRSVVTNVADILEGGQKAHDPVKVLTANAPANLCGDGPCNLALKGTNQADPQIVRHLNSLSIMTGLTNIQVHGLNLLDRKVIGAVDLSDALVNYMTESCTAWAFIDENVAQEVWKFKTPNGTGGVSSAKYLTAFQDGCQDLLMGMIDSVIYKGFDTVKFIDGFYALAANQGRSDTEVRSDIQWLTMVAVTRGANMSKVITNQVSGPVKQRLTTLKTAYAIKDNKPGTHLEVTLPRMAVAFCYFTAQVLHKSKAKLPISSLLPVWYPNGLRFPGCGAIVRVLPETRQMFTCFQWIYSNQISGGARVVRDKVIQMAKIAMSSDHISEDKAKELLNSFELTVNGAMTQAVKDQIGDWIVSHGFPRDLAA